MRSQLATFLATATVAVGGLLFLGCGQNAPGTTPVAAPLPPAPNEVAEDAGSIDWDQTPLSSLLDLPPAPAAALEVWDAIFLQGTKVGAQQMIAATELRDGQTLYRTTATMQMTLKRGRDTIRQQMVTTSLEDLQGRVLEFETRLNSGPTPTIMRGVAQGDKLHINVTVQGRTVSSTLPWDERIGGMFAVEQTLARQPLRAGEARRLRLVTLGLAGPEIVEARLHGVSEGDQLRCHVGLVRSDGTRTDFVCYVDRQGSIQRQISEGGLQEARRMPRAEALAGADEAAFDLLGFSVVRTTLAVEQPHATRRAIYRIRVKGSDPAQIFPSGATQQVVPVDASTADVIVTAIRADLPARVDPRGDRSPGEADIRPNSLIESDDPRVQAMAAKVPASITDEAQLAAALERLVRGNMKFRNYSQAFATAAQVAQSREGDCTEHAVLLAGVLRARHIPARVALGLVYYPPGNGFAFHMWTEAWLNGRWVPFDATLAQGGIGAAHIKVSDTPLTGSQATSALLPVLKLLGQMEIEVRAIE